MSLFVLDSAAVIHLRSVSTGAPTVVSRSQFGPVYWEAAQPSSVASSGDSTAQLAVSIPSRVTAAGENIASESSCPNGTAMSVQSAPLAGGPFSCVAPFKWQLKWRCIPTDRSVTIKHHLL